MVGSNVLTRKALVAWDKLCSPRSVGGLNMINIRVWNKAAITKLYWDLANKKDKLWIQWIHTYYIKGQQMEQVPAPKQASWMVRKIMEARNNLGTPSIYIRPGKSNISQI